MCMCSYLQVRYYLNLCTMCVCVGFFVFFYISSFFFFSSAPVPIHHPHPPLPNSPSVQRQGTGSRHWLDFHTIPSTERHIKLIRVNNCGGALLSGAPISLAWPGHGHTDGLVISDLEAEGTERASRGTAPPPPLEGDGPAEVVSPMKWNGSAMLLESVLGCA